MATPVPALVDRLDCCDVDTVGREAATQRCAEAIIADLADHANLGAKARTGDSLVRALSTGQRRELMTMQRLAADRDARRAHHEIHVETADDDDRFALPAGEID